MNATEAMALIDAERRRQIEVEGWTPEHDNQYRAGELLRAGIIYLWHGTERGAPQPDMNKPPLGWPWAIEWWKPRDRRRNLVRAGALMLAERDRLQQRLRGNWPGHIAHVDHKIEIVVRELCRT